MMDINLGSSAPEILLSIIEVFANKFEAGGSPLITFIPKSFYLHFHLFLAFRSFSFKASRPTLTISLKVNILHLLSRNSLVSGSIGRIYTISIQPLGELSMCNRFRNLINKSRFELLAFQACQC